MNIGRKEKSALINCSKQTRFINLTFLNALSSIYLSGAISPTRWHMGNKNQPTIESLVQTLLAKGRRSSPASASRGSYGNEASHFYYLLQNIQQFHKTNKQTKPQLIDLRIFLPPGYPAKLCLLVSKPPESCWFCEKNALRKDVTRIKVLALTTTHCESPHFCKTGTISPHILQSLKKNKNHPLPVFYVTLKKKKQLPARPFIALILATHPFWLRDSFWSLSTPLPFPRAACHEGKVILSNRLPRRLLSSTLK